MSAFSSADLPDSVNTVEKLHLWSSTLLQHLYSEVTALEVGGSLDRAIFSQPWYITAGFYPYMARDHAQFAYYQPQLAKRWQDLDLCPGIR